MKPFKAKDASGREYTIFVGRKAEALPHSLAEEGGAAGMQPGEPFYRTESGGTVTYISKDVFQLPNGVRVTPTGPIPF